MRGTVGCIFGGTGRPRPSGRQKTRPAGATPIRHESRSYKRPKGLKEETRKGAETRAEVMSPAAPTIQFSPEAPRQPPLKHFLWAVRRVAVAEMWRLSSSLRLSAFLRSAISRKRAGFPRFNDALEACCVVHFGLLPRHALELL